MRASWEHAVEFFMYYKLPISALVWAFNLAWIIHTSFTNVRRH